MNLNCKTVFSQKLVILIPSVFGVLIGALIEYNFNVIAITLVGIDKISFFETTNNYSENKKVYDQDGKTVGILMDVEADPAGFITIYNPSLDVYLDYNQSDGYVRQEGAWYLYFTSEDCTGDIYHLGTDNPNLVFMFDNNLYKTFRDQENKEVVFRSRWDSSLGKVNCESNLNEYKKDPIRAIKVDGTDFKAPFIIR